MNTTTGNGAEQPRNNDEAFAVIERNLGAIINMMAGDPHFAREPLAKLHERLLPPLVCRQFRMVRGKDGRAVAYISWAMVSEEAATRLQEGGQPTPSDWQSGDTALIIDLAAPSPAARQSLLFKVKAEALADKTVKAMRLNADKKPEWAEVKLPTQQ